MSHRGSMLIEALIAVIIMAVGMTVLMQALMNNSNIVNVVGDYSKAWLVMNEKLQEKVFWDKANVPVENQAAASGAENYKYSLAFKTLTQQPLDNLKQMDLSVAWASGDKTRNISLRTILINDETTQTKKSIFYN